MSLKSDQVVHRLEAEFQPNASGRKERDNADAQCPEQEVLTIDQTELDSIRMELETQREHIAQESHRLQNERKQIKQKRADLEEWLLTNEMKSYRTEVMAERERLKAERKKLEDQRLEFEREKEEISANMEEIQQIVEGERVKWMEAIQKLAMERRDTLILQKDLQMERSRFYEERMNLNATPLGVTPHLDREHSDRFSERFSDQTTLSARRRTKLVQSAEPKSTRKANSNYPMEIPHFPVAMDLELEPKLSNQDIAKDTKENGESQQEKSRQKMRSDASHKDVFGISTSTEPTQSMGVMIDQSPRRKLVEIARTSQAELEDAKKRIREQRKQMEAEVSPEPIRLNKRGMDKIQNLLESETEKKSRAVFSELRVKGRNLFTGLATERDIFQKEAQFKGEMLRKKEAELDCLRAKLDSVHTLCDTKTGNDSIS